MGIHFFSSYLDLRNYFLDIMVDIKEARAKFIAARGKPAGRIGNRRVANNSRPVVNDEFKTAKYKTDAKCWQLLRKIIKPQKLTDVKSVVMYKSTNVEDDPDQILTVIDNPRNVEFAQEIFVVEGKAKEMKQSEIPAVMSIDPAMLEQLKTALSDNKLNSNNDHNLENENIDFQTVAEEVD